MKIHGRFKTSLKELLVSFWKNRTLIYKMVKREVIGRYQGSVLGLAWSFFTPLLMLAVYTFVFSVVFKARWGTNLESGRINFSILLFVGMIFHGLFAECANRAPQLVVNNVSYVKKVVFPLEIFPWIILGSALFHAGVSIIVLLGAQLVFKHALPWTVILLPMVMMPLIFISLGFAWCLAAIGVFLRDIAQAVVIFTTVLLFLSPVFYPISALPVKYHIWLKLNPLTMIIEEGRKVMVYGMMPDWTGWFISTLIGICISWFGFWLFQRTRPGFADVL